MLLLLGVPLWVPVCEALGELVGLDDAVRLLVAVRVPVVLLLAVWLAVCDDDGVRDGVGLRDERETRRRHRRGRGEG